MSKNTEEIEEKIKDKLSYLGLNLKRIPKYLKETNEINFKPVKAYDEKTFKVYKYIDVKEIQILLTPTNRLEEISEKLKNAVPLSNFLDAKTEENEKYFYTLLKMIEEMNIESVEKIANEQEKLQEQIPYKIKYENNFMWQIYYSSQSKQYFMLVPVEETNNSAFFYLLKKQIESYKARRKEYIYVPITQKEYECDFLSNTQITDIENYLWYFTKEWPNIYEVSDMKGELSLYVVGKTPVFDKIKSDFVVHLETKDKAVEWYKLLKALFILETGLQEEYKFKIRISLNGELEFLDEFDILIQYSTLTGFINNQVAQKKIKIVLQDKKIAENNDKLDRLKDKTKKMTEEYLSKQGQIAVFLSCKKTFFGKIKYFFGGRKKQQFKPTRKISYNGHKENGKEEPQIVKVNPVMNDGKSSYTIEDLIEICTKLNSRNKMVKNLEMDIKALELKKENLSRKIKNADIYLEEIENHKKSIFDFWKFTNKDELPSLNVGEDNEKNADNKIIKEFEFEEDIEELGIKMDEIQRIKLSKNETDSVFATKYALKSIQLLNKKFGKKLTNEERQELNNELEKLKEEYKKSDKTDKDYEVFGSMTEDKTKESLLRNKAHREIKKDKFDVLDINSKTSLDFYIDELRNKLKLLKEANHKILVPFNMKIYSAENEIEQDNYNIFDLNSEKVIDNKIKKFIENIKDDKKTNEFEHNLINLHILPMQEKMSMLYYTNIMYYDNFNKTLPIGMDVNNEVLVNLSNFEIKPKKKDYFRINYRLDDFKNKIISIQAVEYEIKIKVNNK